MANTLHYVAGLMLLLVVPFPGKTQSKGAFPDPILRVALRTGLAGDNLKWSIAGNLNGTNPNIYSELVWKKIAASQISADVDWRVSRHLLLSLGAGRGFVFSGSATDSDYEQDNRTARTFFAKLDSDRGMTYEVQPALGFVINATKKLRLIPALGYGWASQKYFLLDDAGLNSTYQTSWNGPMAAMRVNSGFKLFVAELAATYHQVNYDARANWNLVDAFMHPVSFEHAAKGYGLNLLASVGYQVSLNFAVQIQYQLWHWSTGLGIDTLYLNDGSTQKTRLNDVTRNGQSIGFAATYVLKNQRLKE